jgi:hypothetical protein
MTPEERQRTMDFITATLARLVAAQEQDRFDRIESTQRHERLLAHIAETQRKVTELITWQSERMDWLDKVYKDSLQKNEMFQNQALRLLNMILDRLPGPRSEAP